MVTQVVTFNKPMRLAKYSLLPGLRAQPSLTRKERRIYTVELLAVSPQGCRHPHANLEKPRTQPALFFLRRFFTRISTSHSYTDIWSRKEIFFFHLLHTNILLQKEYLNCSPHAVFNPLSLQSIDGCTTVVPSQLTSDYPLILVS